MLVRTNVLLDEVVKDKLQKFLAEDHDNLSSLVRRLLKKELDKRIKNG